MVRENVIAGAERKNQQHPDRNVRIELFAESFTLRVYDVLARHSVPTPLRTVAPSFARMRQCFATMDDFPKFMKHPENKIVRSDQSTPGVEGYVFDGQTGAKWHFGRSSHM